MIIDSNLKWCFKFIFIIKAMYLLFALWRATKHYHWVSVEHKVPLFFCFFFSGVKSLHLWKSLNLEELQTSVTVSDTE